MPAKLVNEGEFTRGLVAASSCTIDFRRNSGLLRFCAPSTFFSRQKQIERIRVWVLFSGPMFGGGSCLHGTINMWSYCSECY